MSPTNEPFSGLTVAFRQTTEFKDMAATIRAIYPTWADYMVETAIAMHIQQPRLYRDKKAHDRADASAEADPATPALTLADRAESFMDSVKIYSGPDDPDLPAAVTGP